MRNRESGRFEIRHVPAAIRERDRVIGETRTPVLKKYERVCFEKQDIRLDGKPMADLLHPAHPLMCAVTDLISEAHRTKLKQGAVLIDPSDEGNIPRMLFMIDHSVRESDSDSTKLASRRLQFVEINEGGDASNAGWAPHLDLQPIGEEQRDKIENVIEADWLHNNLDALALKHASLQLAPQHYQEIKERRTRQVDKTLAAVIERLVKEINYWSDRYIKLSEDVAAGKQPRVQPAMARRRVEELTARLEQRKKELERMRNVVSSQPVVVGGALVIPQGLLDQMSGMKPSVVDADARARVEKVAMKAVMDFEENLGHEVVDVSAEKCGWDVTARRPLVDSKLVEDRHIEVKGRAKGQTTITVSRNEIIYALNQSDKFILAVVVVDGMEHEGPFYIKDPFSQEPDFGVASINYELTSLLSKAGDPNIALQVAE